MAGVVAQPSTLDLHADDLLAILQNGRGVGGELSNEPGGG